MSDIRASGYWLDIAADDSGVSPIVHFSGYHEGQPGAPFVLCPNCANQMLPALNLDFSDPRLVSLGVWPKRYLNVLFCPFCAFYMEPYFVDFSSGSLLVTGGCRRFPDVLNPIELPYGFREISLRPFAAEERPDNAAFAHAVRVRTWGSGVYHQVGGPNLHPSLPALGCPSCGSQMALVGILDYDDLNIPLYEEDHRPVALIIGDGDSMAFFCCLSCLVVGMRWTAGG